MCPKKSAPKRERLTLSQLASYDDILTDALVDHVYFWTTIRKNRSKYNLTRGISEDAVTRILLYEVIVNKDTQFAEQLLLKLPGLRKFVERLGTEREKEDFRRHMRKYINMWLPDCPWEVSTTNRYTIVTQEAAAVARRPIKKGETIKYLCGNLVAMSSEEEKDLDLTRRDFSIVVSSRKKTPSLFLGPARFANHDCNANARLVTSGPDGMQVIAVRNIDINEEITVTYGEDYFGANNCECLCKSCEVEGRHGWAAPTTGLDSEAATSQAEGTDELIRPYSFRRKRKYGLLGDWGARSATPDVENIRPSKRRKASPSGSGSTVERVSVEKDLVSADQPEDCVIKPELDHPVFLEADKSVDELDIDPNDQVSLIPEDIHEARVMMNMMEKNLQAYPRPECDACDISPRPDGSDTFITCVHHEPVECPHDDDALEPATPRNAAVAVLDVTSRSPFHDVSYLTHLSPRAPFRSTKNPSQTSRESSDFESIFDIVRLQSSSPASNTSTNLKVNVVEKHSSLDDDAAAPVEQDPAPTGDGEDVVSDSELSEMLENEYFDDVNLCIIRKRKRRSRRAASSRLPDLSEPEIPKIRRAGDYIRTPLLLSEPFSRWVDCGTCSACWVQLNGYFTRKECPRCERHSMLYGYRWPKTDRVKGDAVGRVMDHRTVHRFLRPEDEARVGKRGRGLGLGGMGDGVCEGMGGDGDEEGGGEEDEDEGEDRMVEYTARWKRRRRSVNYVVK